MKASLSMMDSVIERPRGVKRFDPNRPNNYYKVGLIRVNNPINRSIELTQKNPISNRVRFMVTINIY